MSKPTELRAQDITAPKKSINWEVVKTIIITAFTFGVLGLIGGYFASINIQGEARASVVRDMQMVSKDAK